jgi:hypothetical protein
MASLIGRSPKDTFKELLKLSTEGQGVDATLQTVQDGLGNNTPLQISSATVALGGLKWPTSGGTTGKILAVSATSNQLEWLAVPSAKEYDIAGSIIGKPDANAVVMQFVANRAFTLPAGFTGSVARASTVGTGSTVLTVRKNTTTVGTITFAASATVGTFVAASGSSFAVGDVLSVVAPAAIDSTLANVQFTFSATLV